MSARVLTVRQGLVSAQVDRVRLTTETSPGAAVTALLDVATLLGANAVWSDPAAFLEDIAHLVERALSDVDCPPVSDQGDAALTFWRAQADLRAIGYDS